MNPLQLIGVLTLLLLSPENSNEVVINEAAVSTWQTNCASEPGRVHRWTQIVGDLTIERLPAVSPTFRTGYATTRHGDLIAFDLVSGEQFRFDTQAGSFVPVAAEGCTPFLTGTHWFWGGSSQLAACPLDGGECKIIPIADGTFPFAYAENSGHVLAATNYGDVLIFDGADWCRCSRSGGDTYRCDPNEPMVTEPRRVQFYSSINYMGKTLVGEWPTGRLYEFDGEELRPAGIPQPPFVTGVSLGYEAQSMAEYCGDLFVGYWPRGEIWRLNRSTAEWSMAARLFSHPVGEEYFYPYNDPFYGQRVSALVPLGHSLYAATSNLNSWPVGYMPIIMTEVQAAEYGAIHRLTIPGCETIEPAWSAFQATDKLCRNNAPCTPFCGVPPIDRSR